MQMDQFNVFLCVYVLSHSLLISCVCFSAYFEFQFAVCGHCPGTAKDRKPPPGERHRQARVERYEHFFWGGGGSGSAFRGFWLRGSAFMGFRVYGFMGSCFEVEGSRPTRFYAAFYPSFPSEPRHPELERNPSAG